MLPVLAILSEVYRLHWRHVLILFAITAAYAPPLIFGLGPAMLEISKIPPDQMQQIDGALRDKFMLSVAAVIVLSSAIFVFWVRLTLVGPRAAILGEPIRWPIRMVRVALLFALAGLGGFIALLPLGAFRQVLATLVISFLFALLSRRLVEACMDIPKGQKHAPASMEENFRFGALLAAASFLLLLVQTLVSGVLAVIGAPMTANVAAGLFSVLAITVMASIHAIVYRLRTVPPRPV
ncbi:hypothetical protein [Emcibacter sp. SYSU 3D8]|uniref:hypothetical protein n=1 Tax=Emcibacter sp. SYSU 3D8 TaxID=3133969 RepID=UPI0031FE596D